MKLSFAMLPPALLALVGSGCARDLARASSGAIGCPHDAIEVSEISVGWSQASWTARCRDATFYCSGESSAMCAPALDAEASMPASPVGPRAPATDPPMRPSPREPSRPSPTEATAPASAASPAPAPGEVEDAPSTAPAPNDEDDDAPESP